MKCQTKIITQHYCIIIPKDILIEIYNNTCDSNCLHCCTNYKYEFHFSMGNPTKMNLAIYLFSKNPHKQYLFHFDFHPTELAKTKSFVFVSEENLVPNIGDVEMEFVSIPHDEKLEKAVIEFRESYLA